MPRRQSASGTWCAGRRSAAGWVLQQPLTHSPPAPQLLTRKSLAHPRSKYGRGFLTATALFCALHIANISSHYYSFRGAMSTWVSTYKARTRLLRGQQPAPSASVPERRLTPWLHTGGLQPDPAGGHLLVSRVCWPCARCW